MDSPITRAEHNEFVKRMEEEHKRTNHRLKNLERMSEQITDIAISVRELATSVKDMVEEQHEQSGRIKELEDRDGEMWRKVMSYSITAAIGIILGILFQGIM